MVRAVESAVESCWGCETAGALVWRAQLETAFVSRLVSCGNLWSLKLGVGRSLSLVCTAVGRKSSLYCSWQEV
jgi:DNA-binding IclR family transcriptional regulator